MKLSAQVALLAAATLSCASPGEAPAASPAAPVTPVAPVAPTEPAPMLTLPVTWPDAPAPVLEAVAADAAGVLAFRRGVGAPDARLDALAHGAVIGEARGTLALPGDLDWSHALAAVGPDGAWLATWAEPGDGPLRAHRLRPGASASDHEVTIPGCKKGDCWAAARALLVDGDGLWVGGWRGVHSDEVAFEGFVARLDGAGQTAAGWRFDAGDPAFETSVDAIGAVAEGVAVVGHGTVEAQGGDRRRLWVALIGPDGAARGPFDLGVDDTLWASPAAPPAPASEGGVWVVAGVDEGGRTARLLRVGPDGAVARSAEVRLDPGEGIVIATPRLLVGERDGAVVVARVVSATRKLAGEVAVARLDPATLAVRSVETRALPVGADVRAVALEGDRVVLGGQAPGGAGSFVMSVP